MRGWRLGFFVTLILFASVAPRAEAQFAALTQTQALSTTTFGQDTTRGFSFTVSTPLVVQQLGVFDSTPPGGLIVSHPIAIWAGDGTLLTSATVAAGTGAPFDGTYRWVSTTPITLLPAHTYVVGAYFPQSNDPELNAPLNVVFDPRVSFGQARLNNTTGLTYPDTDGSASGGQFNANFKATTAAPVPVLPRVGAIALALLLLGTLVRRARERDGAVAGAPPSQVGLHPQTATGVLLVPRPAGTSLLRSAARRYRWTASAVTQIQGVARKAGATGLTPMAKPTAVRATNTMGIAVP